MWALGRVGGGAERKPRRKAQVSISRNGEENSALENTNLVIPSSGVFAVAGIGRETLHAQERSVRDKTGHRNVCL